MTLVKQKYNLDTLTWTFFATSHGKGAVDGIGAIVKRHVWNQVRSKRVPQTVRNAESFVAVCQGCLKTIVLYASTASINASKLHLDNIWKNIKTVKGTQKMHHIIAKSPYIISCKLYPRHDTEIEAIFKPEMNEEIDGDSSSCEGSISAENEVHVEDKEITDLTTKNNPKLGEWVAVIYDEMWIPGTVENIKLDGNVNIKFMKIVGLNRFIWPETDDFGDIPYDSILTRMHENPTLISCGRGGMYSLSAGEFSRILNLFIASS